jgi:phage terminase small subunit
MRNNLMSWQWQGYATNHVDRSNLALHLVTVPAFIAGLVAVAASPIAGLGSLLAGLGAMAVALIAQGRGHGSEPAAPVPFTGPGDFVSRFLVEQLVTFPRFVLSGGWLRAWRGAGSPSPER